MTFRALTIRQPHAAKIFLSGKNIENRGWATPYRGTLLIHTAITYDDAATPFALDPDQPDAADLQTVLVRGCIIGAVDLVDVEHWQPRCRKGKWGEPSCYHWKLSNPRLLEQPIAHRGQQNIWIPKLSDEDAASITRQLDQLTHST